MVGGSKVSDETAVVDAAVLMRPGTTESVDPRPQPGGRAGGWEWAASRVVAAGLSALGGTAPGVPGKG
ncbi:hypothetical protein Axi01nite_37990 [Actinoplanes xinjiangensis]|nr:hypothetical protein Axi01nite_37990 [Actinoplanes xinjiangensis]